MPTATAKQTALVTIDELTELADWERKYADAKKKVSSAEKELEFRRQSLAEKVLGVKSKEDLKAMHPEQVMKLSAKRFLAGDWKPARGAPEFKFAETSHGRYPAWAKLYVEELGETAAARIKTETPLVYSYCVEVSLP
jgi:hypothetical protein